MIVEKIGVDRSRHELEQADLVLMVLNYNEPLTADDKKLLDLVSNQTTIIIVNKTDLSQQISLDEVRQRIGDLPLITTSLKEERGIEELEKAIAGLFFSGQMEADEAMYVSNIRHIHLLQQARQNVQEVIDGIGAGMPLDIVEIDLKNAWQSLGEIIGDAVSEDLIDQIFSQFCLGK